MSPSILFLTSCQLFVSVFLVFGMCKNFSTVENLKSIHGFNINKKKYQNYAHEKMGPAHWRDIACHRDYRHSGTQG